MGWRGGDTWVGDEAVEAVFPWLYQISNPKMIILKLWGVVSREEKNKPGKETQFIQTNNSIEFVRSRRPLDR